jgi:hypothetical protein
MGTSKSSHSSIIPLWYEQASYIKWVYENKDNCPNTAIEHGAKISLIGMFCSLIEGVSAYVLIENLRTNPDLVLTTERSVLIDEVNDATWGKYDCLFKMVFKRNMSYYVKRHKANIDVLFKFRNSLLHGNALIVKKEFDGSENTISLDRKNYKEVFDFFKRKKVITGNIDCAPNLLLADKVMNYFLDETTRFIDLLNQSVLVDDSSRKIINDHILINLQSILKK